MKSILRKCFHVAECRRTYSKLLVIERIFKIILSKVALRITLQAAWISAQQTGNLWRSIMFSSRNDTFTTNSLSSFRN